MICEKELFHEKTGLNLVLEYLTGIGII